MLRRLAATVLIALAFPAVAQPVREDLARTEAERGLRQQQRAATARDAAEARREIEELSRELATLTADQTLGETTAGATRIRLSALNAREAELKARMGANQSELSRLLGGLQMFSKSPPPALFVHPRDAKAAVRAAILLRAIKPLLQKRADAFAAQASEGRRVRREAAAQAGDLFTTESAIADRAGRIETLIAQRQVLERSLTGQVAAADGDIAALAARAEALKVVVAKLPPAKSLPSQRFSRLTPPVAGAPIRRFGAADGRGGRSEGWTWRTASGARVIAPASGVVEFAGPVNGWKSVLILRLSDDYHLVLAGLDLLVATPGQSVMAGQPVAGMANRATSGLASDAPELVLELRRNGQPVDPARFLPQ